MIDRMIVDNPLSAALLSNERRRHIVLSLIEADRSQQELSSYLSIAPNLLHYHLERLLEAKLVIVSRTALRRGRGVRYFRSVAQSFVIPAELAENTQGDVLFEELRKALLNAQAGTYSGILYWHQDGPRMRVIRDIKAGPPFAELWHRLSLNEKEANMLIEDLRDIFLRYETRQSPMGSKYIGLCALVPSK